MFIILASSSGIIIANKRRLRVCNLIRTESSSTANLNCIKSPSSVLLNFLQSLIPPSQIPNPMAGISSSLRRIYLSLYNWIVFFGWLQVFYLAVKTLRESGHQSVYAAVEKPLILAQSAAILEIFHSLIGIVRSPISATLPQISSRIYVTWGILHSFPEIRTHFFVASLAISWSITEIIRYSFFGFKEAFGFTPSWLLWLRYSTFVILYPTGITSEVGLIYNALPYLRETGKYSIKMPNRWNFAFDYYYNAIVVLGVYVPGIPHLYGYMLGQRKKALSKAKTA